MWLEPMATRVNSVPQLATSTGAGLENRVLSPSSPHRFRPQHAIRRSLVMPHVWNTPALMDVSETLTVTVALALRPPLSATMLVNPAPAALTSPNSSTTATLGLLEDQFTARSGRGSPESSMTEATSRALSPSDRDRSSCDNTTSPTCTALTGSSRHPAESRLSANAERPMNDRCTQSLPGSATREGVDRRMPTPPLPS